MWRLDKVRLATAWGLARQVRDVEVEKRNFQKQGKRKKKVVVSDPNAPSHHQPQELEYGV